MNKEKRVLIASHRGRFSGDIVENTLPAFETALLCGADIIETDIHLTKDGEMILFHDNTTERMLGLAGRVEEYTLEELRAQPLRNVIGAPSKSYVNTLDELLTAFRGRCMINLDQCWHFIDRVYDKVERMGMEEQALIKGRPPYDDVVRWLEKRNWTPNFIPIITKDEEIEAFRALPAQIRMPQVEVFITSDADTLISEAFVSSLKARGIRLWINALSLGSHIDMSAGHDDDLSVTGAPNEGWGWLIEHGAGVIQTDWPEALKAYLEKRESGRI